MLDHMKGSLKFTLGWVLVSIGMVLNFTIIGVVLGGPMVVVGIYLLYEEVIRAGKEIVSEGIAKALRIARAEAAEEAAAALAGDGVKSVAIKPVEIVKPAATAMETVKTVATQAADAAKTAANKTVQAVKPVANKTAEAAKTAASKTVEAAKSLTTSDKTVVIEAVKTESIEVKPVESVKAEIVKADTAK